ncbi:MAG TPA: hypothetical protein VEP89_15435 [Draconibacterium sp.]|nr:hypothetical protein [Draconibacterium sp.]
MKLKGLITLFLVIASFSLFAQENPLLRFESVIGHWEGTGEGFGNAKSKITADYSWLMNKQYIEVKHHSEFEPTEQNTEGEVHDDKGIISFESARKVVLFRQYHNEGYFTEYALNDSISTPEQLIFETERIENFVPGGRARFTINILADNEIETVFDVGFPEREMACFGTNHLEKK